MLQAADDDDRSDEDEKQTIMISPPPLPPRVSKGIALQPPPLSECEDEAKKPVTAVAGDISADRPKSNAPARPPRPTNFTVPPNLAITEEDKLLLSQMTAKPKPASEDPDSIVYQKSERATKFTYNATVGKWEMKSTKVRLAKEHFSEGGMRYAYRAVEVNNDTQQKVSYVVKLFKNSEIKPAVVFHEALTQAVSEKYAQGFNDLCERKGIVLRLKFLPVWVLHLTQRSKVMNGRYVDLYATMEPYLPGKYVKLSDNSGRHLNDIPAQAAQTFSHYSFLASGRRLVCVDIQGVSELVAQPGDQWGGLGFTTAKNMTLTDPQIHSLDGQLFGAGNLGVKGINAFITSYQRTMFDEQLGLAHLTSAHLLNEPIKNAVSSSGPTPQEKVGAPPFDTAELASILAADERARLEDEQEEGEDAFEPLHQQQQKHVVAATPGTFSNDRSARRTVDFSTGGELFKLSVYARDLAQSIDI